MPLGGTDTGQQAEICAPLCNRDGKGVINQGNSADKDDDKENKEAINSEELEPYDILNLKTTLENRLSEIRPLICK